MIFDLAAAALRRLPPEAAHAATIAALRTAPLPRAAARQGLAVRLPVSGLKLPNPVGLAAGFDKNAEVFGPMLRLGFGFVECGTATPLPQAGNPKPRLFRLTADRAVINRMGFNNAGLAAFAARLEKRRAGDGVVGANVGANKDADDRIADYVAGLGAVWACADYVTINISSPNTPGLRGLQDKAALDALLGRAGEAAARLAAMHGPRPVFLKVAPDLDEAAVDDIAAAALAAPLLTGLIVSNTTLARPATLKSPDKSEAGGLSGAPLMAPSTHVLRLFADRVFGKRDLIGVGGIASGADAYAKIRAGAHAVQLYSALVFHGPSLVRKISSDLAARLAADGFSSPAEAAGVDLGAPAT